MYYVIYGRKILIIYWLSLSFTNYSYHLLIILIIYWLLTPVSQVYLSVQTIYSATATSLALSDHLGINLDFLYFPVRWVLVTLVTSGEF